MEYDLPSILGFLFDNPKWWPALRCSLQEAKLAQDVDDGALDTGLGLHGVDVAGVVSRPQTRIAPQPGAVDAMGRFLSFGN